MKRFIALLLTTAALTGCVGMSDREYMLRKKNTENQAKHQQTYEVGELQGPITLENGARIVFRASTQPFAPLEVPDGQAYQRAVIKDAITGAVLGYGFYQAGSGGAVTKNSHNTTTGGTQ